MIVLNKLDVPEAKEMAEFMREELEEFGWPIFGISTATREGLKELTYGLSEAVATYRKDNPAKKEEKPAVIVPKAVGRRGRPQEFEIERDPEDPDGFVVVGRKPRRWIMQTDFENDEAVGFLGDRLAKLGVEEALAKAGATPGCPVTIGDITFEWHPQTAAGIDDFVPSGRGTDQRLETTDRVSAEERKRASQARRGLIDEFDFGDGEQAERERYQ